MYTMIGYSLIVCILSLIVVMLIYLLWNKTASLPVLTLEKKKELPEVVVFLLDELSQARSMNEYNTAMEQLRIILDNTYISNDDLIKLKLNLV